MRMRWLLVVVLATSLAGCSLDSTTQITDNGDGSLSTALGLTQTDMATLAELGLGSDQDICQRVEARTQLPEGGTITEQQLGDTTWCQVTVPFEDLQRLQDLYQEYGNVKVNQLQLADGEFIYDVDVDLTDVSTEGVDPAVLDSLQIAMDWKLAPPGANVANNADQVADGSLVWHLEMGQVTHVHAETRVTSPTAAPLIQPTTAGVPSLFWILGILLLCVVGLVLLAAVVILLIDRSRHRPPTQD